MKALVGRLLAFLLGRLGCALFVPVAVVGLVLLANSFFYFLADLDSAYLDFCVRFWGQRRPSPQVVIAGIDDEALQPVNFNRLTHAQVIENLRQVGARAVFYDLTFDEPRGPEMDGPFVDSLRPPGLKIVLAAKLMPVSNDPSDGVAEPTLMDDLQTLIEDDQITLGMINTSDAAIKREGTLAWQANGRLYPSAALALLALVKGVPPNELSYSDRIISVNPLQLPVSVSGTEVVRAFHMPVVYTPPATGPDHQTGPDVLPVVPYLKLRNVDDPVTRSLKDCIVFIGDNSSNDSDLLRTPVGRMKGVEIHAQIFNTMLEGPRWRWPQTPFYDGLLFVVAALGFGLALLSLSGASPVWGALAGFGGLVAALTACWLCARAGLIFPVPLCAIVGLSSVLLALLNRYGFAANFLSRFVPKEVAQRLLATGRVQEGEIVATVIVTDIRGYTTLSETKTPLQILSMLNEYHTETVAVYHRYDGRVLNYQGDAQIVLFGLPEQNLKDPAGNAVQAALETALIVEQLRERWGIADKANFDVGAGVCTGPVAVGDLGSEHGAEYTVIGETVRKCHKVQSQSNALNSNVLLDEPTYEAFRNKSRLVVERVENVELEGISYPVTLYRAKDK